MSMEFFDLIGLVYRIQTLRMDEHGTQTVRTCRQSLILHHQCTLTSAPARNLAMHMCMHLCASTPLSVVLPCTLPTCSHESR